MAGTHVSRASKQTFYEFEMAFLRAFLLVVGSFRVARGFVSAGGVIPQDRVWTDLRGGYDATIVGANPTTPIQFFAFPGKTCPYAQRTHIALLELGIPFDMTEVTAMPKPDWYLKIHPVSTGFVLV